MQQLLALCLCLVLLVSPLVQQRPPGGRAPLPTRPRLVVGIMIDQFRADYLVRFADQFVPGGFRRLLDEGANFVNAHYAHIPTYTACGHATFMSGASPSFNGIVGNEWFERETGRRVTSVTDDKVKELGGDGAATSFSPVRLIGSTLGDELRLASGGQSRVVGIAFKDRSAILPAGKRPNGAYWFDDKVGAFVSSTYYFNELPGWASKFNRDVRPDRYFGAKWDRLLPEEAYRRSRPDNAPEETARYGNTFPYTINGGETAPGPKFYARFEMTPFANDYAIEFAKSAIENEGLGADDVTDLLTISFSPNDLLGHSYGPYSQEMQDMILRTDRLLADFFSYLDRKVGLNRTQIVLSSDHGIAPIPEQVRDMNVGGRIDGKAITGAVQTALRASFGEEKWVSDFVNSNIYLDEATLERKKANREDVERTACAAILKVAGVSACFTRSELLKNELRPNRIAANVARGFYSSRSGDLIIVPQPYFFFFSSDIITTHGTPYRYDTHVPVIFFGPGITPGTYFNECSPADIAPTLSALLGLTPPSNSEGRVLAEAIKR
jgi:predicted AlkP superfamily pyrophosphatase or phosphodiesterase